MGLFSKLLHKEATVQFACANCYAPITESTYRKNRGKCEVCLSPEPGEWPGPENPWRERAERRRAAAEVAKTETSMECAKCGRLGASIALEMEFAEKQGQPVLGAGYPLLLLCEKCQKYFCGRCQVDLGIHAGCPWCGKDLEQ